MVDQDRTSARAHAIWENAGKPDGVHDEHWQQACREMEIEDNDAMSSQAAVPDMPVMNGAIDKSKAL